MHDARITVVNRYTLKASVESFQAAISALSRRVRDQGHPGILSYRFFANAGESSAHAIVDYADAAAWIGHHDIAMGWPEMSGLHATAALAEITFLGTVTPEILAWLNRSSLTAHVKSGNVFVAGFRR